MVTAPSNVTTAPLTELALTGAVDEPAPPPVATAGGVGSGATGPSFGDVLEGLVDVADRADASASEKVDALARGASDDLHGTMIAVKEADISVKLVASIRNKLLDAFNEIWKTSV